MDRGLSKYDLEIVSITTSFDNGGSTGKLRDEFGTLPQGDVRRRILALSQADTHILRELFTYRFKGEGSLSEQSLGNIILTAASDIWGEQEGIDTIAKLFGAVGRVVPITYDKSSDLCAKLSDGSILETETKIDLRDVDDVRHIENVFLSKKSFINNIAKKAIEEADFIVICPGDLYTSIIPNFLVEGFFEAIQNSNAKIIWISNLMTKKAETHLYDLSKFLEILQKYLCKKVDVILSNSTKIPEDILQKYEKEERAYVLKNNINNNENKVVEVDLLSQKGLLEKVIRHSSSRVAYELMNIFNKKIFIWDLDDTIVKTTQTASVNKDGNIDISDLKIYNNVLDILKDDSIVHVLVSTAKHSKEIQNQKIDMFSIRRYFKEIIIVDSDEKKLEEINNLKYKYNYVQKLFVIGDNTESELKFANDLGMKSVRVKIDGKRKGDISDFVFCLEINTEEDFLKLKNI